MPLLALPYPPAGGTGAVQQCDRCRRAAQQWAQEGMARGLHSLAGFLAHEKDAPVCETGIGRGAAGPAGLGVTFGEARRRVGGTRSCPSDERDEGESVLRTRSGGEAMTDAWQLSAGLSSK